MIRHVCQCDIISLQKRKPGIIIFKIKCITHTFWHLINKAENTFVMARTIVIHQTIFKLNPDIIFIFFFYLKLPFFPVRFAYQKLYIFIIHQIMIIQNIFDLFPAYRNQFVSRFNFQFFCNASRQYFWYDMFAFFSHTFFLFSLCQKYLFCTLWTTRQLSYQSIWNLAGYRLFSGCVHDTNTACLSAMQLLLLFLDFSVRLRTVSYAFRIRKDIFAGY